MKQGSCRKWPVFRFDFGPVMSIHRGGLRECNPGGRERNAGDAVNYDSRRRVAVWSPPPALPVAERRPLREERQIRAAPKATPPSHRDLDHPPMTFHLHAATSLRRASRICPLTMTSRSPAYSVQLFTSRFQSPAKTIRLLTSTFHRRAS